LATDSNVSAPVIRATSSWSYNQIDGYLRETEIPVRLACLNEKGAPLICSLWYIFDGSAIWCASQATARIIALLEKEPRCAFEIAGDNMPYRGVRGQGHASLSAESGADILVRLIARYLPDSESDFAHWLLGRRDSEVAIKIQPEWLTAWDFGARMST